MMGTQIDMVVSKMVYNCLRFILLLLCILPYADSALAGKQRIVVFDAGVTMAMDHEHPSIWKPIINSIASKEQWEVEFINGSENEGWKKLQKGAIDIVTAVPNTQENRSQAQLNQESVVATWAQIYTHPDVMVQSLLELDGKIIGVLKEDIHYPELRTILQGMNIRSRIVAFKTDTELMAALEKKWVDAALIDRIHGAIHDKDYRITKTSIIFSPVDYRFSFPKSQSKKLIALIDFHLRTMKNDPKSVYNRWVREVFGISDSNRINTYLVYGLCAGGAVMLLVLVNSIFLKRQVKIKTRQLMQQNVALSEQLEQIERAETALIESEKQFRSLFNATSEGIAIHEVITDDQGRPADYRYTDVNPAFCDILELKREDVIDKKSLEVFDVDRPPFLDLCSETMAKGVSQKFEAYFNPRDKHFSIRVFKPREGQFVTVFEDITSSKKTMEAIKASEEKYRLLVENAHDAIIIVQHNRLQFFNARTQELLHYTEAELNQLPVESIIYPDDRRKVMDTYLKRMAGQPAQNNYTFRSINRDNDVLWVQINAVQVEWEGGPAILCMIRDISEEKKLENQLLQAQKMQAIGTLAGGIAHDFNNILAAIIGYTELGLMHTTSEDKVFHHLNRIFEAGRRAKELVNQILSFSRQKEIDFKPINIRHIVQEAMNLLRASVPSTIQFEINLSKDSGTIVADPTQIHQLVMNICTNASHAMRENGGKLAVALQNVTIDQQSAQYFFAIDPGPYVQLRISDTGQGMDQKTQQRIFDPYYTTKKTGEGTGLGLSVVHGIVKSLKGEIKVYSETGKGTTFTVYIPRAEVPETGLATEEELYAAGSESILLVDDEEIVSEMTSEMLKTMGYTVTTRVSAIEALKVFSNDPDRFDLVITDQTMPQKTGSELAAEIMNIRPDIPVILCTGFSSLINEDSARSMGIRAFLKKPILKKELSQTVRDILDEPVKNPDSVTPVETGI